MATTVATTGDFSKYKTLLSVFSFLTVKDNKINIWLMVLWFLACGGG